MKNVKLKVLSAIMVTTLVLPVVTAKADTVSAPKKFGMGIIKQQQNLVARQDWTQQKSTLIPKRDTIKQNAAINKALREEVKSKEQSVKGIYKDIAQNHKELTADDLAKIQAQLAVVDSDVDALSSTKGTIKTANETIKFDLKSKNIQDAEIQLDNVISIQNTRTDGLKKLNADLDNLISILQTAEANATIVTLPSKTTTPTTTNPTIPNLETGTSLQ